jgi:hypothetical protein
VAKTTKIMKAAFIEVLDMGKAPLRFGQLQGLTPIPPNENRRFISFAVETNSGIERRAQSVKKGFLSDRMPCADLGARIMSMKARSAAGTCRCPG